MMRLDCSKNRKDRVSLTGQTAKSEALGFLTRSKGGSPLLENFQGFLPNVQLPLQLPQKKDTLGVKGNFCVCVMFVKHFMKAGWRLKCWRLRQKASRGSHLLS